MRNVPVNLTIDRHINNGSARIRGRVDGKPVDLSVARGAHDGTARVSGDWQSDSVQLNFHREAKEGYNGISGSVGERRVGASIKRRQPDGDTEVAVRGDLLDVDRQDQGQRVELRSRALGGGYSRALRDGDESGAFRVNGERVRYSIDRDTHSGDFLISGVGPEGRFGLQARRDRRDGDLTLTGSLPENAEMFPLYWEILGDDKNIIDRNPLYPGSLMAMSMFMEAQ